MFAANKKIRAGLLTMIASVMSASTLIAVSTSAMSSTANSAALAQQETQNIAAKDELKMKLSKLVSYSANFSQSISDINGKELQRTSGTLTLKTPNMLRWETQLPDETLLIADGTTVWNVDPFVEQVTVMQQASITQNNPLMLLVSDDQKQWNAVTVEKKESRFMVVSQDENANIISLNIEFSGDQLTRLQSTDRQQQKSLLIFSNIEQNQPVAQMLFSYQIPENYIIDDQRSQ
ncbi:outer membrane lipoprotein chaperone LolA [Brumicola nitratireducens]|uniref:Outer-membrane lipoprotein carrier protein n=1 Tax=Glaciecola nitratireducens (strain JCM 12485 / KCTC 12276 / FR1064) TaxID=1085623 RepID=G4QGV6_GLANF|nr:outer membrane lipoprotein chaperone LolA [Glaciecola nitratireducens]AEP29901.1 outer membrane lipoprotein carrier protein LolA [Glaciecola nitratireducens FR1064]